MRMSEKDKQRWLVTIIGVMVLIIIWLLMRHNIEAASPSSSQPDAGVGNAAIPNVTYAPGAVNVGGLTNNAPDYSFLLPKTQFVQAPSCSCDCDSTNDLNNSLNALLNGFAGQLQTDADNYQQAQDVGNPDWLTQYINNGNQGPQLGYLAAPVQTYQLVFSVWGHDQRSDMHSNGMAGKGWWNDPVTGAHVGYGTPASESSDGKNDIALIAGVHIDPTEYDMTTFQLVNGGVESANNQLTNPVGWNVAPQISQPPLSQVGLNTYFNTNSLMAA